MEDLAAGTIVNARSARFSGAFSNYADVYERNHGYERMPRGAWNNNRKWVERVENRGSVTQINLGGKRGIDITGVQRSSSSYED